LQGQYYKLSKKFQEFVILASLEAPTTPHAQICIKDHLFSSKFDFFGFLNFVCMYMLRLLLQCFFFLTFLNLSLCSVEHKQGVCHDYVTLEGNGLRTNYMTRNLLRF
jgi:hypothetical protein